MLSEDFTGASCQLFSVIFKYENSPNTISVSHVALISTSRSGSTSDVFGKVTPVESIYQFYFKIVARPTPLTVTITSRRQMRRGLIGSFSNATTV